MIDQSEYISLYNLLTWASKHNYNSVYLGNNDLLEVISSHTQTPIPTYTIYSGINPRITKNKSNLIDCLNVIEDQKGFYEDIPF